MPSVTIIAYRSNFVEYLVGGEDLKEPSGTSGGGDVWVGLLREAVEGGLDLGVGTVLPNPENLVGALPRELLVRRGCGARRPAAPGDRREGRLAAADAGKEESPELRRA